MTQTELFEQTGSVISLKKMIVYLNIERHFKFANSEHIYAFDCITCHNLYVHHIIMQVKFHVFHKQNKHQRVQIYASICNLYKH